MQFLPRMHHVHLVCILWGMQARPLILKGQWKEARLEVRVRRYDFSGLDRLIHFFEEVKLKPRKSWQRENVQAGEFTPGIRIPCERHWQAGEYLSMARERLRVESERVWSTGVPNQVEHMSSSHHTDDPVQFTFWKMDADVFLWSRRKQPHSHESPYTYSSKQSEWMLPSWLFWNMLSSSGNT